MCLDQQLWMHYNAGRERLSAIYEKLYWKVNDYACENFTGDDARYFFTVTD